MCSMFKPTPKPFLHSAFWLPCLRTYIALLTTAVSFSCVQRKSHNEDGNTKGFQDIGKMQRNPDGTFTVKCEFPTGETRIERNVKKEDILADNVCETKAQVSQNQTFTMQLSCEETEFPPSQSSTGVTEYRLELDIKLAEDNNLKNETLVIENATYQSARKHLPYKVTFKDLSLNSNILQDFKQNPSVTSEGKIVAEKSAANLTMIWKDGKLYARILEEIAKGTYYSIQGRTISKCLGAAHINKKAD